MKNREFLKGFGTAACLAAILFLLQTPFFQGFLWKILPLDGEMPREAKIAWIESCLDEFYVEDIDKKDVNEMLYTGMSAGVGDRYTYYLPQESMEQYMENTNGSFHGIGVEVYATPENEVFISSVMKGYSAEKAGLRAGDLITGVDGEDVTGLFLSDVAAKIRGKEGTEVTVTVYREETGETLDFTAKREEVVMNTVESRMLGDGIGYISLSGFKENTYDQFKEAYKTLEKKGMEALVLDVRNNPGGLVKSVYEIGEELLPEGTMVYTVDKAGHRTDLKCDKEYHDIPLAVLVNENSASASEILSGAVKDTKAGTVIGTQTFGKGLVQRLFELPDGSGLNVTIEKYYTPGGTSINGVGVTPDIVVELPEEYRGPSVSEIPESGDTQLAKAVDVLKKQTKK